MLHYVIHPPPIPNFQNFQNAPIGTFFFFKDSKLIEVQFPRPLFIGLFPFFLKIKIIKLQEIGKQAYKQGSGELYLSWSSCTPMSFKSLERKNKSNRAFKKKWNREGNPQCITQCALIVESSVCMHVNNWKLINIVLLSESEDVYRLVVL